jgi:hypothetical protein
MLVALIIVSLLASPLHAALERETPKPSSPAIRYADGRLSVRLDGVPLDVVLAVVERETGIVIHGDLLDWREVTKHFEDVPIARALQRLVGRQNFVLRYDQEGSPVRLDLLGRPGRVSEERGTREPPQLATVIAREPPVPVPPALHRLFAGSTVRLMRVLAVAFRHNDPAVRSDARRVAIGAFESRATLREALRRSSAAQIAKFLRPWPAAHVQELLHDIKTRTRDPMLRGLARQTQGLLLRAQTQAAMDVIVR